MDSRQIEINEIVVNDLANYLQTGEIKNNIDVITTTSNSIAIPADKIKNTYVIANEDAVNHPSHYTQGGIECIDAIDAAVVGLTGSEAVNTGNVIKYMWRWKFKNGLQDLFKTMWYLTRLAWQIDKTKTIKQLEKLLVEYKGRS